MTFKLVQAAGVPGRWIGAGDAKFEKSPLTLGDRVNRATMSHSFHPEGPLLCAAVKRMNDLKRWEICGELNNRQTMNKNTYNDEDLSGQLGRCSMQ